MDWKGVINWPDHNRTANFTVDTLVGRKSYWALALLFIPSFALFGNLLVIVSVVTRRSLHSAINYFILGLAVADLCLAMAVMPFAVYVEFNENWELGTLLCDVYCAADVTCSTASIFLLTVISFDRYVAATQPIRYANSTKSMPRVAIINLAVWLVSMLIASPMVLGLNNVPNRDVSKCMFYNADFIIYSSTGSFCIPLVIILYLYGRIYCVIRQRGKLAQQRHELISAATRGSVNAGIDAAHNPLLPYKVPPLIEHTPATEWEVDEKENDDQCLTEGHHRRCNSYTIPETSEQSDTNRNNCVVCDETVAKNQLFPPSQAVGVAGIRCSLVRVRRTLSDSKQAYDRRESLYSNSSWYCEDSSRTNETDTKISPFEEQRKSLRPLLNSKSINGLGDALIRSIGALDSSMIAPKFYANRNDVCSRQLLNIVTQPEKASMPETLSTCTVTVEDSSNLRCTVSSGGSKLATGQLTPSTDPARKRRSTNISFSTTVSDTTGSEIRTRLSECYYESFQREKRLSSFLITRLGGKRSMDETAQKARSRWLRRLSTRLVLWNFHRENAFGGGIRIETANAHDRYGINQPLLFRDKARRMKTPRKSTSKQRKEKKATKTLAIVLGIFLICWLPFFALNLLNAFCIKLKISQCQVGFLPFFFTTWLGYTNSAMNPIIYTIFNADFRRAFKEILYPCVSRSVFKGRV